MRSNVAIFYRCQCIWAFGGIRRFKRTEFQDAQNETVDESEEKIISVKYYWGKKSVFNAYDTKYLRGETEASDRVLFQAYDYSYLGRIALLLNNLFKKKDIEKVAVAKLVQVPLPVKKPLVDYIPRVDKYAAQKGASVLE
jgi:ABC-type proline/glycine betaine transport system substrate-binding protein